MINSTILEIFNSVWACRFNILNLFIKQSLRSRYVQEGFDGELLATTLLSFVIHFVECPQKLVQCYEGSG